MVSEAKMEKSWQDVASQQADFISSRLRELLSSGLDLLRSELGVDFGLKPELYPSWVILLTAVIGLLLIVFSWAAACNGLFGGRKRGARAHDQSSDSTKDSVTKTVKTEEQKKRNKKKPVEKQTQPNGRMLPDLQEADDVSENTPKPSPEVKTEKAKKNKKKPKTEVKPVLNTSCPDGKEPDEAGAWETKISNREKRQQRRKDKVSGDGSGSPGGVEPTVTAPVGPLPVTAPVASRKSRGEPLQVKHGKGETVVSQVAANWSEAPAVNGGRWNNMAMKLPAQMSSLDGEKWPNILKETPPSWGLETAGSWSGLDGKLTKDLNPVSLPVIEFNHAGGEPVTQPAADLLCYTQPVVDDVWSGLNGVQDTSSDWNPPSEEWGNYEEPQAESSTPPKDPTPEAMKESDDEKEKGDASSGAGGKSKKKKKKKKKQDDAGAALQESEEPEEEAAVGKLRPPVQEMAGSGTPAAADGRLSVQETTALQPSSQVPQRLPEPETLLPAAKQNSTPPSSQKKSEENWESSKQVQKKKKARRET